MITFQTEEVKDWFSDAEEIFPVHWEDLALDRDRIPMCMNRDVYEMMEERSLLLTVTARDGKKLIGYYIAVLMNHPHYKHAGLMAATDMFYILRSHRSGGCGAKLLLRAEQALKQRGVVKASIGTKLHQDQDELLTALGWSPTDRVYSKLL